ncbi:MAG: DUF2809 domain-containing protein [Bacteroidota bacterium]
MNRIFQQLIEIFRDRRRQLYTALIIGIIPIGLYSRIWYRSVEDQCTGGVLCVWGEYAPDALYALMFYWLARWVWVNRSFGWSAMLALAFCYGIEVLQFYHAPWIDAIRATPLGGLILGFSFLWSDIVCYSLGVGVGVVVDVLLTRFSLRLSSSPS